MLALCNHSGNLEVNLKVGQWHSSDNLTHVDIVLGGNVVCELFSVEFLVFVCA